MNKSLSILFYFAVCILPFLVWELTTNQLIGLRTTALVSLYAIANGSLFASIGILVSMIHKRIFKIVGVLLFLGSYTILLLLLTCKFVLHLSFSPLILNALFDTTISESSEYLGVHTSLGSILIIVFILLLLIILFRYFNKSMNEISTLKAIEKLRPIGMTAILYSICIFNNDVLYARNMFNEISNSYKAYNEDKLALLHENFEYLNHKNIHINKHIHDTSSQVFVLVIGESHARGHMSLYGYPRKTNPFLESLKSELSIFDNVISPASTTVLSLKRMLTFASFGKDEYLTTKPALLDVMNANGYKTWWLSNQQVSGAHDTWSKLYAKKADVMNFINTTNSWYNYSFDESLLPIYEEALLDTNRKKFIVLHLIGSHERADRRYKPSFNYFTNINDLPNVCEAASKPTKEYVNYYDNSVLYNDSVVAQFILQLKAKNANACLLYVSDHGEELGEQSDFHGHHEGATSKYMCEIPFYLWSSSDFKNRYSTEEFSNYLHRPFQTDNLSNSILDLLHIREEMSDTSKSIFNRQFRASKRFVNSVDYDSLYKSEPQRNY